MTYTNGNPPDRHRSPRGEESSGPVSGTRILSPGGKDAFQDRNRLSE